MKKRLNSAALVQGIQPEGALSDKIELVDFLVASWEKQNNMLSNLVKQHQAKQQARKEIQERRKKDALVAATALTHVLVDHLNAGVAQAYVNQKKLDTETKILQANASQFSKQTVQWLKLVEDFNTALKEIGDVENWARSIETDMRTISSALEYAYNKNE